MRLSPSIIVTSNSRSLSSIPANTSCVVTLNVRTFTDFAVISRSTELEEEPSAYTSGMEGSVSVYSKEYVPLCPNSVMLYVLRVPSETFSLPFIHR